MSKSSRASERNATASEPSAAEAISASKYNEIRNEQKSLHGGKITLLPGEKQPSIPAMPPGNTPPPSIRAPTEGSTTIAPTPQPAPTGAIAPGPASDAQTDPAPAPTPER
jgi:hypothetical protein